MTKLKIAGLVLLGGLWLGGCATQDYVDKKVAGVEAELNGDQSRIDGRLRDQDARMGAIDQTSREALDRARAAGKLAEGKFVYSMVLSDDTTKFPVNGSTLSDAAVAKLADFAARLKAEDKNVYLEIQGYTDSTGTPASNLRLGADRAEAVRRVLNRQGVALNRMATISYGQDAPTAPNTTREGRAQNRRVVIVVLQ
jgi:outer membrane protein OmpA-like peptidoglycan-associated protein